MTKTKKLPKIFYKYFWEIEPSDLDIRKYKFYVIARLLEFGDISTCRFVLSNFSSTDIQKVVRKSRQISSRTRHFWQLYL